MLLKGGATNLPARQQTLRATIDWSYELLNEDEKTLFGRLSVFAGGSTLEAIEEICDPHGELDMLEVVGSLLEKSLLRREEGADGESRFVMLETIQEYAREKLEESGEAEETRRRHAALIVALAERAHPELRGPDQVGWMRRLGRENDNLRAAIAWALSSGEAETAARLCWALWPFWWYRGNHREGRRLAEAALQDGADLPPELRIRATVCAEIMAYGQADNEAVARYAGELLESSRRAGRDPYAEAYANGGLGLVALNRGDLQEATMRLEGALPLFLESGEVWTAAQAHTWMGTVLLLQGDRDGAVARFEEGLALARRIGDRTGIYNALYTLAQVALLGGELEPATSGFVEGMSLSEEMGDLANAAYCLEGLAAVAGARGEVQRSARLFGAAQGLLETIGVPVWTSYKPDRSLYERTMADLREALGEAAYQAAFSEGRAMPPERAVEYALEEGGDR
jgi:tetratricopeptide (TPR) repeat protein